MTELSALPPLDDPELLAHADARPWSTPAAYWPSLTAATRDLDSPVATLSLPALAWNARDMLRRAGGVPIRVASKSIRIRSVIDAVLRLPGYHGVLAYTLAEALWLAEDTATRPGTADVVVAYPTADRGSLLRLAASPALASRITIMVDSLAQLDLIDSLVAPGERAEIRLALELDASFVNRLVGHIGAWRSPVHSAEQAAEVAAAIVQRPGFRLVGMMSYEAQIAGLGNRPIGKPISGAIIRRLQASSSRELRARRHAAVAAVREVADLEFVNGGGTGSLESTALDSSVTEIAAGSGLMGPRLFDNYAHFQPAPAAAFGLSVVRKPTPTMATLLGGGWLASGPGAADRLPQLAWPEGLRYVAREGAGEVQSPVQGAAAKDLAVGDRVWLRHVKAGELSEHVNDIVLVDENRAIGTVPTYRGEGQAFL